MSLTFLIFIAVVFFTLFFLACVAIWIKTDLDILHNGGNAPGYVIHLDNWMVENQILQTQVQGKNRARRV
jgi:hypothetical protein